MHIIAITIVNPCHRGSGACNIGNGHLLGHRASFQRGKFNGIADIAVVQLAIHITTGGKHECLIACIRSKTSEGKRVIRGFNNNIRISRLCRIHVMVRNIPRIRLNDVGPTETGSGYADLGESELCGTCAIAYLIGKFSKKCDSLVRGIVILVIIFKIINDAIHEIFVQRKSIRGAGRQEKKVPVSSAFYLFGASYLYTPLDESEAFFRSGFDGEFFPKMDVIAGMIDEVCHATSFRLNPKYGSEVHRVEDCHKVDTVGNSERIFSAIRIILHEFAIDPPAAKGIVIVGCSRYRTGFTISESASSGDGATIGWVGRGCNGVVCRR